MKIKINNKKYTARKNETVLEVCRREGLHIPTLCSFPGLPNEGVCRLCVIEVNGRLMTSCNTKVCDEMEIVTESENITKARKINLELLWADHAGKCSTCKKNRRCELQNLAEEFKIENFHFIPRKEEMTGNENLDLLKDNRMRVVVDESNPVISRTTELCVECRRCINICPTKEFGFNNRAGDVVVGTPYNKSLDCTFCGQCVKNCPTGAITDKNDLAKIQAELDEIKKMAVAIVDPAIFESIQHEFPEIDSKSKFIGLLRVIGFEKVFDLSWGLEASVKKMAEEFESKKQKNRIIGNCPAINLYIAKYMPYLQKNILQVDLPDEIMAEAIKNDYAKSEKINPEDILVVSVSACTAKKKELKNVNYVLTMREIGRLFREKKIAEKSVARSDFDKFFNAKDIFSNMQNAGGTIEAVIEKLADKKIKSTSETGIEKAKLVLTDIVKRKSDYDLIEIMMCEDGCVNGGGQARKIK